DHRRRLRFARVRRPRDSARAAGDPAAHDLRDARRSGRRRVELESTAVGRRAGADGIEALARGGLHSVARVLEPARVPLLTLDLSSTGIRMPLIRHVVAFLLAITVLASVAFADEAARPTKLTADLG